MTVKEFVEKYGGRISTGLRNIMKRERYAKINVSRFFAAAVCGDIRNLGKVRISELARLIAEVTKPSRESQMMEEL